MTVFSDFSDDSLSEASLTSAIDSEAIERLGSKPIEEKLSNVGELLGGSSMLGGSEIKVAS